MTGGSRQGIYRFFKGRVALHALLRAAGVGPGDQVLLPGYTCVVVPNAVRYLGAEPVFLDIDPATYNLAPRLVKDWLESTANVRSKVLIVQHTYGIPCDMAALSPLAEAYGLVVIEDACHALGSTYRGRPVGTLGDAAFFSTQWSKPLTTGLGGWAVVNRPDLEARLRAVMAEYPPAGRVESLTVALQYMGYALTYHPRLFWIIQGLYRWLGNRGWAIGSSTPDELAGREPPRYRKAMGPIQTRQLDRALADLTRALARRRRQTALLEGLLAAEGLPTLALPADLDPVVLRYPVRVRDKARTLAAARRRRIQLGDWFRSPVHPSDDPWADGSYRPGSCPVAEDLCRTTVNVATGPRIPDREIERTVRFLGEVNRSDPFAPAAARRAPAAP